jgi:hypothetical protein
MSAASAASSLSPPAKRPCLDAAASPSQLTAEQLERMERNRIAALERRRQAQEQQRLAAASPASSPSSSPTRVGEMQPSSYSTRNLAAELNPNNGWSEALASEFSKPYFAAIERSIADDVARGITVYPPRSYVFAAFNKCPYDAVKVVILGQGTDTHKCMSE